ncbi:MAG: zf-HC2 domain-containing protein [Chthonomonadales bacterium]|nr:zf-HC2 domain-containing protein [Chthonomonadales bacterium]
MTCLHAADLLDAYLDLALAEEANARVEHHLLACAGCAAEAASLQQTRAHLRGSLGEPVPSPAFVERLGARLLDAFAETLQPEPGSRRLQRVLPGLLAEPEE